MFLHLFDRGTLEEVAYRIDFQGWSERKIKVSYGSERECGTPTKDQKLPTWVLVLGGGAAEFETEVLVSKPHVNVPETLKCLRIPNYVFPEK